MAYQLVFTESYLKRAGRFAKRHPELKSQYEKNLVVTGTESFSSLPSLTPVNRAFIRFAFGID